MKINILRTIGALAILTSASFLAISINAAMEARSASASSSSSIQALLSQALAANTTGTVTLSGGKQYFSIYESSVGSEWTILDPNFVVARDGDEMGFTIEPGDQPVGDLKIEYQVKADGEWVPFVGSNDFGDPSLSNIFWTTLELPSTCSSNSIASSFIRFGSIHKFRFQAKTNSGTTGLTIEGNVQ